MCEGEERCVKGRRGVKGRGEVRRGTGSMKERGTENTFHILSSTEE